MRKKILAQVLVLILLAYVSASFAQRPVTIEIVAVKITLSKEVIEADLKGLNIYQDDSEEPFTTLDAAVTPWIWEGDLVLVNGRASLSATAFDTSGNESGKSPMAIFDPPPGVPTITIEIRVATEGK